MKLTIAVFASCLLFAFALTVRPVHAAATVAASHGVVQLADGKDDVKDSKDKADRSKTNPNDGKDNNPNDGNAGKGNDNNNKSTTKPA